MARFILSLDQGTTSSRAIVFDKNQEVVGAESVETKTIFPKNAWVEQDAVEIWNNQLNVAKKLLKRLGIKHSQIDSIGITNQRETVVVWDKNNGNPIYNAIIWQDKRGLDYCKTLKEQNYSDYINKTTGLVIDSYFSASKIKWVLDNVYDAREKAEKGELLFGTIDTWLVWKLSNGEKHITDYSNASRTMLFNINTLKWDEKLLHLFDIPKNMMAEVVNSSDIYTQTANGIFDDNIKIAGMAGDQQAALFGQTCFEPGQMKNTYGTGCFLLMNTGDNKVLSKNGLLTTIAWGLDGKITYALEGSVFIAGALIKWLRDGLKIIDDAKQTEQISIDAVTNDGVYIVPAFNGLGAPYWDETARGAIFGLTQATTEKQIVRASLEALAFQTKDLITAMEIDSKMKLVNLNVDGGASANNFLMQFQANLLNCVVNRPQIIESTALGAAYLAGLASGFWEVNQIINEKNIEKQFYPFDDSFDREKKYKNWKKAVERCRNWLD